MTNRVHHPDAGRRGGSFDAARSRQGAYVKKAQDLGHKELVANCASCHKAKIPTAKDWTLNDTLGNWLAKKKKDTGAKEVDLKWLKDYKPQSAK